MEATVVGILDDFGMLAGLTQPDFYTVLRFHNIQLEGKGVLCGTYIYWLAHSSKAPTSS